MLTRREFIRAAALFALAPQAFSEREKEIWVNDVHSQLNRTRVRELLRPQTRDELASIIRSASRKDLPIAVSGCRHSMGGQQFATDSICIDARQLDRVISFDRTRVRELLRPQTRDELASIVRSASPKDLPTQNEQCWQVH